jgi:hypothetical protein
MAEKAFQFQIQLDPKQVQELKDFVWEQLRREAGPSGPPVGMEPITIPSPEGERVLFIDDAADAHWPLVKNVIIAKERGWRMAWAKKA